MKEYQDYNEDEDSFIRRVKDGVMEWITPNDDSNIQKGNKIHSTKDGRYRMESTVEMGRPEAPRWDPTVTRYTIPDGKDLSDIEVSQSEHDSGEVAKPIIDPTDLGETEYINPIAAEMYGNLNMAGFEIQNMVLDRREEEPDPTVNDPSSDAYWPYGDKIPIGYMWIDTKSWQLMVWGQGEAPVPVIGL